MLEVVIGGEGGLDVHLLHDDEGAAIDEGPGFVGAVLAEFPGGLVDRGVNVNDLNIGGGADGVDDFKDPTAGLTQRAIEERDEFADDVVAGDDCLVLLGCLGKVLTGLRMVGFAGDK